jgi:hypothetical protein
MEDLTISRDRMIELLMLGGFNKSIATHVLDTYGLDETLKRVMRIHSFYVKQFEQLIISDNGEL